MELKGMRLKISTELRLYYMMLMMMPYYEFHDCIDTLDLGRSERNVAFTEAKKGWGQSNLIT
jgi:hypothetical protein